MNFTVVPPPVSFTAESGVATLVGPILVFGSQSGPVTDTVTVTIGGTGPVTFQTATVIECTPGTAFSKGADTCSRSTRNPGDTCTITVNFNAPTNNSPNRTLSVPYTGAGGSPVSPGPDRKLVDVQAWEG